MNALSNTPIDSAINSTINGVLKTTVIFKETPKMSTYLLAFIVSKYKGLQNSDKTFGVFSRPEAVNQTELALEFGQEMLKKLGEYVKIDYYSDNVTKMDMAVRT